MKMKYSKVEMMTSNLLLTPMETLMGTKILTRGKEEAGEEEELIAEEVEAVVEVEVVTNLSINRNKYLLRISLWMTT